MGLKLVTDEKNVKVRVFDKTSAAGNNYKSYCLSVASKDKNNNWVNGLINCNFPKARKSEIADKTIIKINNAFPVVEEYQNKAYISYMINDFEVVGGSAPNDFVNIPEGMQEELPFQ